MLEHVLIVERILGREIRQPIEVHHIDGNGRNNAHSNLVVCPNHSYHALIHARTEALIACGNPAWRKCCYCRNWDAPENLAFWKRRSGELHTVAHKKCANEKNAIYRAANPDWVAKNLEKRRQRYAADPEMRARIVAGNKFRYREKRRANGIG